MATINYERLDLLSELSRKTTAYHDAPADRVEEARLEYIEALRKFYSAQANPRKPAVSAAGSGDAWLDSALEM